MEHAEKFTAATIAYVRERIHSEAGLAELRQIFQLPPEEIASKLPGERPPVFGGDTTCVGIETSEGHTIILDCGSGLRGCATDILRRRPLTKLSKVSLFGSHAHLDHRNGLAFAGICFADPPFEIEVFGGFEFLRLLDTRFGLFSRAATEGTFEDDPVDYSAMTASFRGIGFRDLTGAEELKPDLDWEVRDPGEPVVIGSTTVQPFRCYHGAIECLGYRLEHHGKVFVFSTDHEKLSPETPGLAGLGSDALGHSTRADQTLAEMCRGADLAYFDGQFLRAEYLGQKAVGSGPAVPRVGWGHGCVEDILDRMSGGEIKHALIGHHDPERSWSSLLDIAAQLQEFSTGRDYEVELARDGQVIDL